MKRGSLCEVPMENHAGAGSGRRDSRHAATPATAETRTRRARTVTQTRDGAGRPDGVDEAVAASPVGVSPTSSASSPLTASAISSRATPMSGRRRFLSLSRQRRRSLRTEDGVPADSNEKSGDVLSTSASTCDMASPTKTGRPVSISKRTTPNDQTSVR